ncbi:hypothetical protein KXJ72_17895 (plasmid) [Comamonas aquatica]|nr:hypothetical protein KXJ72_17895 [Comamonas aquatica]
MNQNKNPIFEQEDSINSAVVGESVVLEMGRPVEGLNAKQSLFSKLHAGRKRRKSTTGITDDVSGLMSSSVLSDPDKPTAKKKPTAWVIGGAVLVAAAFGAWHIYGDYLTDFAGAMPDEGRIVTSPQSSLSGISMPASTPAEVSDAAIKVVPDEVLQSSQPPKQLDVMAIAAQAELVAGSKKEEIAPEIPAATVNTVVDTKNLPLSPRTTPTVGQIPQEDVAKQANLATMDALLVSAEISSDLLDATAVAKAPPVAKLSAPLSTASVNKASDSVDTPQGQGKVSGVSEASLKQQKIDSKSQQVNALEQAKRDKPEPKPEMKPEPKPEVKPEPKPEVKPEPKPKPKPKPKPAEKPELKPAPKSVTKIATKNEQVKSSSRVESKKVNPSRLEDLSGFALPIRELLPNGKPVQTITSKPDFSRSGSDDQRLATPRDAGGGQRVEVVHVGEDFALVTNPKTQLPMRVSLGQQLPNGATVISLDGKTGHINTNRGKYGMN